MKALVVYESMYGNTRDVAEAIAAGLSSHISVEAVEVGAAPTRVGADVGLLIVGGPTHAFIMSRISTRADAAKAGPVLSAETGIYVTGTKGPLVDGELERAHRWGEALAMKTGASTISRRSYVSLRP